MRGGLRSRNPHIYRVAYAEAPHFSPFCAGCRRRESNTTATMTSKADLVQVGVGGNPLFMLGTHGTGAPCLHDARVSPLPPRFSFPHLKGVHFSWRGHALCTAFYRLTLTIRTLARNDAAHEVTACSSLHQGLLTHLFEIRPLVIRVLPNFKMIPMIGRVPMGCTA